MAIRFDQGIRILVVIQLQLMVDIVSFNYFSSRLETCYYFSSS